MYLFTKHAIYILLLAALNLTGRAIFGQETKEQFFESKIRPLLIEHCIECHNNQEPAGGLSLESRSGWSSRQVIVPGRPDESPLIQAVRYASPELQMPPRDSGDGKLSSHQIELLTHWVAQGAFDPRTVDDDPKPIGPQRRSRQFQITQQDLQHWAYQPLTPIQPSRERPEGDALEASATIDQLVDAKLKELKISRNPIARPRELVRRAYFDLWGLPPEPQAVETFASNPSDQAWRELVDRLLDSHYYGERWGRYWLDWVRYAETNGYERDGIKPNAWRYRDYVVRAFNDDKPYDRFLTEQLAGDLLIEVEKLNSESNLQRWQDAIIATGFYRLHVWDDEPDSSDAAEYDDLDDIMVTTGAAFLGLTLGCARCHDHKFDPFSQADYYAMVDFLRDIDPYGLSKKGGGGRGTGRIERFLADSSQLDRWHADQQSNIQMLESEIQLLGKRASNLKSAEGAAAENAAEELEKLNSQLHQTESRLSKLKQQQPPFDKALAINPPDNRKQTFLLARGDYQAPGQQVSATVPLIFHRLSDLGHTTQDNNSESSAAAIPELKNRLALAKWLSSPTHPLTARVLANRIWLGHFGEGIVPTPDDFGYTGQPPTNPALVDYLATELIHRNWSIKSLHRAIMNSQAYRSSSQTNANTGANQVDPENRLFWRQNLRRLDAEAIRDSMLSYAGTLIDKRSGPSVYGELSDEIRETANPVSISNWPTSPADEQTCRSIYLVVKRSLKDPLLESFDFANSHSPVGKRVITTVAPQALMMLNDAFVQKQASKLAERILRETEAASTSQDGSDDSRTRRRLQRLWQVVLQRELDTSELEQLLNYVDSLKSTATNPNSSSINDSPNVRTADQELRLWTDVCKVVLNCNETLYVD